MISLTGCQLFKQDGAPSNGLSPLLLRMRQTYSDLESGRFVSLADFETPPQAELFRLAGPDGAPTAGEQPAISMLHGRNETGTRGLRAVLNGSNDVLWFDGQRSQTLALIRDWRDYAVLLVSLHGPPAGATLEFAIQSGVETPARWARVLRVEPGWKLYRFDLAEIGEQIDLADVRALTWRAPQANQRVELFLDDLILADNTRHLFGEKAETGQLYVLQRGRRLHVGARGRFDLAFCDGLLVSWTGEGRENLVAAGGLGPWAVPLPEGWLTRRNPVAYDDPRHYAAWGLLVDTRQRLAEASPLRVVVEGMWRFVSAPPSPEKPADAAETPASSPAVLDSPAHIWRYVVYPSGQTYVTVTSAPQRAEWPTPWTGYALALDGRRGFQWIAPRAVDAEHEATGFVLLSRPGAARADVLWVPHARALLAQQMETLSQDERRQAVVIGAVAARETVQAAHLLRFWPPDLDAIPEAESFAADYQNPAMLRLTAGRVVTDAPGDLDADGYNEGEGCYELAAENGVLRFEFQSGGRLRHEPAFRVREIGGRPCWAYLNGRLLQPQARDARGNLLLIVPGVVNSPMTMEVNVRADAGRR